MPGGATGANLRAGGAQALPPNRAALIAGLEKNTSQVTMVPQGGAPRPPAGAACADEDPGWVDEDDGNNTTGKLKLFFLKFLLFFFIEKNNFFLVQSFLVCAFFCPCRRILKSI